MKKDTQQLKSYKVLLIGDSCEDVYSYGSINRKAFEDRPVSSGVSILNVSHIVEKPGMAKNVLKNLSALGHDIDFITNPEIIRKERFVDTDKNNKSILRVDYNDNVKPMVLSELSNIDLSVYDCIVISDYDKGFISEQIISTIISSYDGKIFVDSKKKNLKKYENCIIKINEYENERVEEFPDNYELVITLGSRGARWNNKNFKPAICEKVIDICGAGDTFFASFIIFYLHTNDFTTAIKIANQCAASVLKHIGNHYVSITEFNLMLESIA